MSPEFVEPKISTDCRCPVCGEVESESRLIVRDVTFLSSSLHLSRCMSCGTHFFTDEDPVVGYDFAGFNEDYWYNYVQNGAGITAMLEPLLAIKNTQEASLIDIGCGFGFVPHYWKSMGYGDAIGLETSQYGRVGSSKLGFGIVESYYRDAIDIHGRKFQYVFSSEVIEHTSDPKAFIREISAALEDAGILVLTTPSATGICPKTDKSTLLALLSPGFHYFVATKDSLQNLLTSIGFKHVLVHDTGVRLMAWASHAELPDIEPEFRDWQEYFQYLETLSEHPDLHIAGGAAYRLLKDSVNMGMWQKAFKIYPKLVEISKSQYAIDLEGMSTANAWTSLSVTPDYKSTPSWLGCALLFCGLVKRAQGISPKALKQVFRASIEIMKKEIEVGAQFAQEPSHFLPLAQSEFEKANASIEERESIIGDVLISERAAKLIEMVKENSSDADLHRALGLELHRCGLRKDADEALLEACRLAPSNPDNHITRGLKLMGLGKLTEAHACFRYALNCEPSARLVHALLASTCLALGADALAEYHACRSLIGSEREVLETDALARKLLNTAQFRTGSAELSENFEDISGNPTERAVLRALKFIELGEYEVGLFDLAAVIDQNPDDEATKSIFKLAGLRFITRAEPSRRDEFLEALEILPALENNTALECEDPRDGSIDIVIPVHNALVDLQKCIASIRKWPSRAMGRIILVDDASDALTSNWMREQANAHSDIHLVSNAENVGFTRSVMTGVRKSEAPFCLMLNSDTIVTPGWLDGLWDALNRHPMTALAGPLTNNSYFQTIQPHDPALEKLAEDPDLIAAMVRTKSRNAIPVVPLLSGFCLLIRRAAFDSVDGLDESSFPWGYWEVQDLCLRLAKLGWRAVIADNVYVHHSGGRSIAGERKNQLISDGARRIYEIHSALRFHFAEVLCASQEVLSSNRQAWDELEAEIRKFESAPSSTNSAGNQSPNLKFVKMPRLAPTPDEICIFVVHAPLGCVSEYTISYLRSLTAAGITVLLCMMAESLIIPVDQMVVEVADGIVLRENLGFDFAAWADMLRGFPEVWRAKRLYFANDSVIGPIRPLDKLISDIRSENCGFFALTDCSIGAHHAQSYFFGWSGENLEAPALRDFWASIAVEETKQQVIDKYERAIMGVSRNLPDKSVGVLYGFDRILASQPDLIPNFSMSHHAWKLIISKGFPFVKTNIFRDRERSLIGDTSIGDWEDLFMRAGGDIATMRRHVETSQLNRVLDVAFLKRLSDFTS